MEEIEGRANMPAEGGVAGIAAAGDANLSGRR